MYKLRVLSPELLDVSPPHAAAPGLRDLRRINRWLGGHWVLRDLMSGLVGADESFSLLDVGAASGDMGEAVRKSYPRAMVTSLDKRAFHLCGAPNPRVVGDAFQLPFRPKTFDIVLSSLFLHHFEDERVTELLSIFGAIARRAVVIIDLHRNPLAAYFLPVTKGLFGWDSLTVHDGTASVAAAFRRSELFHLARAAGLAEPKVRLHLPWFRLSLVAAAG